MSCALLMRSIATHLQRFGYTFIDESQFQRGISTVLDEGGFRHQREYVAGPTSRLDFLVDPGIAIEAKIQGSLPTALLQVDRYAELPEVTGILLVTTSRWEGAAGGVAELRGKPFRIVTVRRLAF